MFKRKRFSPFDKNDFYFCEGLCALNRSKESNPVIVSLGEKIGQIKIIKEKHAMYVPYQVHKTIINNLSLNYDGDLLATASEKVNQLINTFIFK